MTFLWHSRTTAYKFQHAPRRFLVVKSKISRICHIRTYRRQSGPILVGSRRWHTFLLLQVGILNVLIANNYWARTCHTWKRVRKKAGPNPTFSMSNNHQISIGTFNWALLPFTFPILIDIHPVLSKINKKRDVTLNSYFDIYEVWFMTFNKMTSCTI